MTIRRLSVQPVSDCKQLEGIFLLNEQGVRSEIPGLLKGMICNLCFIWASHRFEGHTGRGKPFLGNMANPFPQKFGLRPYRQSEGRVATTIHL